LLYRCIITKQSRNLFGPIRAITLLFIILLFILMIKTNSHLLAFWFMIILFMLVQWALIVLKSMIWIIHLESLILLIMIFVFIILAAFFRFLDFHRRWTCIKFIAVLLLWLVFWILFICWLCLYYIYQAMSLRIILKNIWEFLFIH